MSHNGDRSYYTSSRSDKPGLPPLREVLPEQFPARAGHAAHDPRSSHSQHSSQSSMYSSRPHSTSHGPNPADDSHYRRPPSRSSTHGSYPHQSHAPLPSAQEDSPNYAYGLHRFTPRGLVQERTSTRDEFPMKPHRQTDDPNRRYPCKKCGDRFDRPVSLETHMRTHTGEKPYVCTVADCQKSFSTTSNMRRHERTHNYSGAFEDVEENDDSTNNRGSRPRTSTHNPASSQYYTSTRKVA